MHSRPAHSPPSVVARAVREPLVHFLVLGVGLFALFALRNDERASQPESVIDVTPAQASRLAASFAATWRRPPTEDELAALVDDFVEEEVYYREALALGLDQDDTVIRRRLRQKMEFLAASRADAIAPGEAELRAHFASHLDRFTEPARLSFAQVYLGAEPSEDEIDAALTALAADGDPRALGRPTLLPARMDEAAEPTVDGGFGPGFFARAAQLETGAWPVPFDPPTAFTPCA